MLVYLGFEVAPEKEIARYQIWRRGGHPMSPRKETKCPGNIYLRIPSERRDVWAVASSCWNRTFSVPCSSKRSSYLGRRTQNAVEIAQLKLSAYTVSGPIAVRGRPVDFLFKADCLYEFQHPIVNCFLSGTGSHRPNAKRMPKARCVIIGEPPFWMNSLTTNTCFSSYQVVVCTENGMNTSV
jgi:hypothetical protein